jgi:hypothetical protein
MDNRPAETDRRRGGRVFQGQKWRPSYLHGGADRVRLSHVPHLSTGPCSTSLCFRVIEAVDMLLAAVAAVKELSVGAVLNNDGA